MYYNRLKAVEYAHEWAFERNPKYINFAGLGGDCTSFVSQCIHAGGGKMDYTKTFGWYYNSANDRAPAWSGVQYFYNFFIKDNGIGPYARETDITEMDIGDVVQLSFYPGVFSHTLLVVETKPVKNLDTILIATHTIDSDYRPLSSYSVLKYRYLKILEFPQI